ncbi:hypothetical protein [Vibrio bivalvicida]|uniref:Uncharacterized protein n=1 Tax=Vibrio bivalvicida TaxID=1276888 RepID=A0ABV4MKL2_9VIBR
MGYDTPMAISNYLGVFLAILITYPFVLVTVNIAVYSPKKRKRVTKWLNIISATVALILMALHMQTEVIYGKELIEKYYRDNPQAMQAQPENSTTL